MYLRIRKLERYLIELASRDRSRSLTKNLSKNQSNANHEWNESAAVSLLCISLSTPHDTKSFIDQSIIMANRRGGRSSPQDNDTSDSNNKNNDHRMLSPSFPPSAPDAFMSDSPRQSRPQPSQSTSHYFMDGGLHHRSSRSTSLNIDHRSLPSTVTNNTHNSNNITRPSRLFHLYNPYHGNR